MQALEDELKISQYKEILRIIGSDKKLVDKKKELVDAMHDYGHDVAENVLCSILLSDQTEKYLNIR